MRFLPVAALVAIVWCDTSNENLEWKSSRTLYITLKRQSLQQNQQFSRFFEGSVGHCRSFGLTSGDHFSTFNLLLLQPGYDLLIFGLVPKGIKGFISGNQVSVRKAFLNRGV